MPAPLLALCLTYLQPMPATAPLLLEPAIYSAAALTLNVDAKDGDSLTGERIFKVTAALNDNSLQIVNKVEFYVNGELRNSEASTPYRFPFDTINEPDGAVELKWIAYTDQGTKGTKILKLTINNGLSQGVDAHVALGKTALQDGKYDEAVTQGRIALKIDKKSTSARFLLANAYLQQGVLDKAQSFVEDVISDDPKNLEALNISSAISLKQAFNTINKGGNQTDTLQTIKSAFASAVDARRKQVDAAADAAAGKSGTAEADADITAQRYSAAANVLLPIYKKDTSVPAITNRLAYAQIQEGRLEDAIETLSVSKKGSTAGLDSYGQALLALALEQEGKSDESNAAMKDAILSDISNLGVRSAQASIALRRNQTAVLQSLSSSLAKDAGARSVVNYLLASLSNRLHNYTDARNYFERSVLADPLNVNMYVEQGNQAISVAQSSFVKTAKPDKATVDFQYASADLMFSTALAAKGDSFQALTGLAIVNLLEGKKAEGLTYAKAAVKANPTYAGAVYALSAAFAANGQVGPAQDANDKAGQMDKEALYGRPVPEPAAAWRYFSQQGRPAVITVPE